MHKKCVVCGETTAIMINKGNNWCCENHRKIFMEGK